MNKFISIPSLSSTHIPELDEQINKINPVTTPPDLDRLGEKQLEAVETAMSFIYQPVENRSYDMLLINGAAGTGKSTAINTLLHTVIWEHAQEFSKEPLKVAIAGLTHTAKDVLKTTCPIQLKKRKNEEEDPDLSNVSVVFTTLHSLLNYKQKRTGLGANDVKFVKDKYSNNDISDYDIVIVDEVSMLDNMLFKDIFKSRKKTVIILVGDGNQLPPVNKAGKSIVFYEQAQEIYKIHTVTLDTIYRQGAGSPIITSSQKVLKTRSLGANNIVDKSNFLIHVDPKGQESKATLMKFVAEQYHPDYPFKYRVITFTNKAVKGYNTGIRQHIYGDDVGVLEQGEYIDIIGPYNKWKEDFEYEAVFHNRQQLQIQEYKEQVYTSEDVYFLVKDIPYLKAVVKSSNGRTGTIPLLCEECREPLNENIDFIKWQLKELDKKKDKHKLKYKKRDLAIKLERLYNLIVPFHYSYAGTTHSTQGRGYTSGILDLEDMETCLYMNPLTYKSLLYTAITRFKKSIIVSHKSFY